jgi:amidohydrolase
MLLGAAKYFSDHKEDLNGTVKLFFQSAEEGPMPGGGIYMVEGGHVDECDAVFGQHIVTRDELHSINIKKGPAMAAPDEFKITVTGIGTHASAPQTGVDAILCSADIIQSLQMITSRNISALENAVISVSTIHGGTAFNILPDKVEMTGTIRTLKPNIREFVFKRMTEIVESVGKTHNATAEIEIIPAYPPVINDPEMCDFVLHIAKELNLPTYELDEPSMGGEDFAYYLQKKPGAFLWLGAQRPNSTNYAYNHNPLFDPDEDALLTGMLMHVNIVTEFLK